MNEPDGFEDVRDLYQDVILERGRRPHHARRLNTFDQTARGDNPMCGDRIEIWVRMNADKIGCVGFEARGCAISIASADLMVEAVQGRDRVDAEALFAAFRSMARTGTCPECDNTFTQPLAHLAPLSSVHEYPSRVKCATLPWYALIAALDGLQEASSE